MAEKVISEVEFVEDTQSTCDSGDWKCMLENYYKGYLLFVEAVVQIDADDDGNSILEVYGVDVTDLNNSEIDVVINNLKIIYPNAVEYRIHFCGNHIGKPCKMFKV